MTAMLQDIRYALRQLYKDPGFTAVAVVTLALGIGANAALFSIVSGVLLNRLPYPQPERLVTLSESKPNFDYGSISYPNFRDWQKENRTFSSMAIYRGYAFSLTGSGEPMQVNGGFVSSELFPLLGVKPWIGRTCPQGRRGRRRTGRVNQRRVMAAQIQFGSGHRWQKHYPDGKTYTVIGVVPASFHFAVPSFPERRDVFVPSDSGTTPCCRSAAEAWACMEPHGLPVTFEQAQAIWIVSHESRRRFS